MGTQGKLLASVPSFGCLNWKLRPKSLVGVQWYFPEILTQPL